ncbi:MAG: hypothetical protein AVDCRST_MAG89-5018, partial [uncultured Gemmatimonadetes bacterium]
VRAGDSRALRVSNCFGACLGCPHPRPLSRKRERGEFDRASAGLVHSASHAVREGGLWALVAATSVAPAGL